MERNKMLFVYYLTFIVAAIKENKICRLLADSFSLKKSNFGEFCLFLEL